MRRRWRIWRGNPNANARLAQCAVLAAVVCGAAGRGNSALFNILALVAVAAAGWFDGRYADAVGEFWPKPVKHGAVWRLATGAALILIGWWFPDVIDREESAWIEALSSGALFGGAALMLSGLTRVVMTAGARYAGRKLQERLDDDF